MAIRNKKCIICGGPHLFSEVTVGKWRYIRCINCEAVFLDQFPTSEELTKIYSYKGAGVLPKLNSALYIFSKIGPLRLLIHLMGYWVNTTRAKSIHGYKKGKVLDIGAGPGDFMKLIQRSGWDVYGTEVSQKLVKNLGDYFGEAKIFKGEVFNIKFEGKKFDLVTMWHVFEHVPNYLRVASYFGKITNKNANIIIEVPHANSLNFKIFKENWVLLLIPQHLHFWSRQTFQDILNKNGFYIKKVEYPWHFPFVFFSSLVRSNRYAILFFPVLMPLSLVWSVIISYFKRGDVIRIYASK